MGRGDDVEGAVVEVEITEQSYLGGAKDESTSALRSRLIVIDLLK